MAIPASELVSIPPRVLSGSGTDLAFNGALLTENSIAPVGTVLSFGTASAVSDYFGYESDEYKMAMVYFNGYDNSTIKPGTLFVYRHASAAVAPFLRGAKAEDEAALLSSLKSVGSGTLTITIGTEQTIQNVNFGEATSLSDCAQILQTAIQGASGAGEGFTAATVTYSSITKAFTITAGTTGAQLSISYGTGDVAETMLLTESAGAVISLGADAHTYTETLDNLTAVTQNFVTYTTVDELTDEDDIMALAQWSNTAYNAGNQYLYVLWSNDDALKRGSGDIATIATKLQSAGYAGVTGVYGDCRYPAFVMGAAGSIDWNGTNTTITFAFKGQSGLEANVTDKASADNLKALGFNFIGDYASRNDNFIFFQKGQMYGDWAWIDTYLNSCWLNNALQVQILAGFEASRRVSYTEVGYTQIRAWCQDVIDRAKNNGVIEAGVNLSQTQITQLTLEAGIDISNDLYANGYYLQILDATAQIRQQRESPSCNFWYTYGGAVHKLNIPSTAVV